MIRTSTKLKRTFGKLGIGLKKAKPNYYKFEYEFLLILLSVNEEQRRYAFFTSVIGATDGINESLLEIAMSAVESFHENFSAYWNDGSPLFASPHYSIDDADETKTDWFLEQIKEFWDAYMFLEANLHLLGDDSIKELVGIDNYKDKMHMDKKELNRMIAKRFIVNDSLIAVSSDDISQLKKTSNFIDGCQETITVNEVKDTLDRLFNNLHDAHPGDNLKYLAIKFFANIDDGFDADINLFIAIHDFLETLGKDVEVQWGLSRDGEMGDDKVGVCMIAGFIK